MSPFAALVLLCATIYAPLYKPAYNGPDTNNLMGWWPLNGNTVDRSTSENHGSWCGYQLNLATPSYTNHGNFSTAVLTTNWSVLLRKPVVLASNCTIIVSKVGFAAASFQQLLINSITYFTGGTVSRGFQMFGDMSSGFFYAEAMENTLDAPLMLVAVGTNTTPISAFALVRSASAWTVWRDVPGAIKTVPLFGANSSYTGQITIRGLGSRRPGTVVPTPLGGIAIYNTALTSNQIVEAMSRALLPDDTALDSTLSGNNIIVQTPTNFSWANTYPLVVYCHGAGEKVQSPLATAGVDNGRGRFFDYALTNGWIVAQSDAGGNGTDAGTGWGNTANTNGYSQLIDWMTNTYRIGKIVTVGASMGGVAALDILAARSDVVGSYDLFPVCSLYNMWTNVSYTNYVTSAYGITTPASFTNLTAGHDPLTLATNLWSGKRIRLVASYSDTITTRTENSDAFTNRAAMGGALEYDVVTATGQHDHASHWTNYIDFLSFLNRCNP